MEEDVRTEEGWLQITHSFTQSDRLALISFSRIPGTDCWAGTPFLFPEERFLFFTRAAKQGWRSTRPLVFQLRMVTQLPGCDTRFDEMLMDWLHPIEYHGAPHRGAFFMRCKKTFS